MKQPRTPYSNSFIHIGDLDISPWAIAAFGAAAVLTISALEHKVAPKTSFYEPTPTVREFQQPALERPVGLTYVHEAYAAPIRQLDATLLDRL